MFCLNTLNTITNPNMCVDLDLINTNKHQQLWVITIIVSTNILSQKCYSIPYTALFVCYQLDPEMKVVYSAAVLEEFTPPTGWTQAETARDLQGLFHIHHMHARFCIVQCAYI